MFGPFLSFKNTNKNEISQSLLKYTKNITQNKRVNTHVHDLIVTLMQYNAYHSPYHILSMLDYANKNFVISDAQKIAILFHDIIYIPHEKDNEEKSAEFMKCILRNHISKPILNEAEEIIRATARHLDNVELCESAHLVMDLDLATLAHHDYNEFLHIGNLIREEFLEVKHIDYYAFLSGRIKFFRQLLNKDSIFRTKEFQKFEQLAQSNIKRYINENEPYPE